MVERGRHTSPITPLENRLCKCCDLNKIEDEYHFVMECSLYNSQRNMLFSDIKEMLSINNMSDDDIFILIMCAKDFDILQTVINFVNACFAIREGKV